MLQCRRSQSAPPWVGRRAPKSGSLVNHADGWRSQGMLPRMMIELLMMARLALVVGRLLRT